MSASDDTTQRDLAGMEIVLRRHSDQPSVDLHDTTDAVADYCPHGICSGCCEDRALQARIDDLEAKLAEVTRERDEARELLAKSVWAEAENDSEFVKAATRGKADIEAGRTVQWTPEDNANNRA